MDSNTNNTNSTSPIPVTPAQQPYQPQAQPTVVENTQNYGVTDYNSVNNSAPSPAGSTSAAYIPQATEQLQAQPKPEIKPNAYPVNQQIIPQTAPVPAQPAAMAQVPQSVPNQPAIQSDAVFQPSPPPVPLHNLQQPTSAPVPQPGMPMSMGGVQTQTPNQIGHHSGPMAYWPAIVGGGVIVTSLVVFLIVFL